MKEAGKRGVNMMIDSKILRERLNNKSAIPWHENDRSTNSYKQGYLSGLIKALAILGEVEYFTEHGKDREPIDLELSDDVIKGLTAVTGAVADKIKELEVQSHDEKYIAQSCIGFMEEVHAHLMEYMDLMDVEHTEGIPTLTYTNFEVVQALLLSRTKHGGGTSTRQKCRQLGIDPYGEVVIGKEEEEE